MFTIEGWYDIPNAIADNTSPLIGTISKIVFCLIVLIGGMFGMSFVTSSFTDELAVDNNDNVMKELQELKEMIKKQNEKFGDNDQYCFMDAYHNYYGNNCYWNDAIFDNR